MHCEIADPALSGVSGHGNTSGCSISHSGGAPPQQLWCKSHALLSQRLNCQNKARLGSGKLVLGFPHGRSVIPHPLPMRSTGPRMWPECCGSQLQMGLRSLLHGVRSFSLSLCARKESSIPGFFAWFHSHIFVQGFYPG